MEFMRIQDGLRAKSQMQDVLICENGVVMGLCVAGLGVLGVSVIYLITGDIDTSRASPRLTPTATT